MNLFWGIAGDGSVMISDNVDLVKASCAKSFAPFPAGDIYTLHFLDPNKSCGFPSFTLMDGFLATFN